MLHHALPVFAIEARSQRAAPGKARPFVAEVDNHQIGRLERAAGIGSAAATCDRLRQI